MKELAIIKLTKSFFVKVGQKAQAKKEQWAQEAALSVEENKKREAEFKSEFKKAKAMLTPAAAKDEAASTSTKGQKEKEAKTVAASTVETSETKKTETKKPEAEKTTVEKAETKTASVEKTVAKPQKQSASKESTEKKTAPEKKKAADTASKPTTTKKPASKKEPKTDTKKTPKPAAKKATGSKKAAKLLLYSEDIKKHYGAVDEDFLAIIVKNLGPSIYRKDAELVSCSDPKELDTVRKNFLIKKLGMQESDDVLNGAIKEVCEELKASRNKYRATFYYSLAKKFKLESKLS